MRHIERISGGEVPKGDHYVGGLEHGHRGGESLLKDDPLGIPIESRPQTLDVGGSRRSQRFTGCPGDKQIRT